MPAKDLPLLEQIAFVEHKETMKKLGVSQKQKKMKPLVAPKENSLMGTQRIMPSKRFNDNELNAKEILKKNLSPDKEELARREQVENERMIQVLNKAFNAQVI